MIKGIPVKIEVRLMIGKDKFNKPVYDTREEYVDNVLIGEPSTEEIADTMNLTGKKLEYTLAIPKGDKHDWKDAKVSFFGKVFRTIGDATQGIDEMIPLAWNKKVKVAYDE